MGAPEAWTARGTLPCPHEGCRGEVDVPPGTFDGSVVQCWTEAAHESVVVVCRDGSWALDPNVEDELEGDA